MKTFLKEVAILSVYDFQKGDEKLLGRMLTGLVIKDETNRFKPNFRVITSIIKTKIFSEFITKKWKLLCN